MNLLELAKKLRNLYEDDNNPTSEELTWEVIARHVAIMILDAAIIEIKKGMIRNSDYLEKLCWDDKDIAYFNDKDMRRIAKLTLEKEELKK